MTGYYDYVLGLIPLTLLSLTGLLVLTGVELTTAVPLGASVSGLIVGHALFVNGPVDSSDVAATVAPGNSPEATTAIPERA